MKEEELFRVFIGGLAPAVHEDDLRDKFKSFGTVSNVSLVHRQDKEGDVLKAFGYLNLRTTQHQLSKCFAVFGGTKWKGHALKVQLAKDDFMERLQKEWENPEPVKTSKKRKPIEPIKEYKEYMQKSAASKKAIPGMPIEGERNWVIGKYGRPLPIVHIQKGKKLFKHDPSKHCHCIKKIADAENDLGISLEELTWNLEPEQGTLINGETNSQKHSSGSIQQKTKRKRKVEEESNSDTSTEKSKSKSKKNKKEEQGENDNDDNTRAEKSKSKKKERNSEEDSDTTHEDSDTTAREIKSKNKNKKKAKDSEKPDTEIESKLHQVEPTLNEHSQVEDDVLTKDKPTLNEHSQVVDDVLTKDKPTLNEHSQAVDDVLTKDKPTLNEHSQVEDDVLTKDKPTLNEHSQIVDVPTKDTTNGNSLLDATVFAETPIFTQQAISTLSKSIVDQLKHRAKTPHQDSLRTQLFNSTSHKQDDNSGDSETDEEKTVNMFDFEWEGISSGEKLDFFKNGLELREIDENKNASSSDDDDNSGNSDQSDEKLSKSPSSKKRNKDLISTDSSNNNNSNSSINMNNSDFNMFDFTLDCTKSQKAFNFLENVELKWKSESETDSDSSSKSENNHLEDESVPSPKKPKAVTKEKSAEKPLKKNQKKDKLETLTKKNVKSSPETSKKEKKQKRNVKSDTTKDLKQSQRKHEISEETRRKSLEVRNQQTQQNKELVQNALKANGATSNNRIVFGDDDDGDSDTDESVTLGDENDKAVENVNVLSDDEEQETKSKRSKKTIFDEDEDEDETIDMERFNLKPQFQGEGGKHLFKMQLKFNDARFCLDERFADDTNDMDIDNADRAQASEIKPGRNMSAENVSLDEDDLHQEKKSNMAILESVLGRTLKHPKSSSKHASVPFERYDPSREEHSKFEVEKEEKIKKTTKKRNENEVEVKDNEHVKTKKEAEEDVPIVSTERFYEVDTRLKSLFGSSKQNEFSFFGNGGEEEEEDPASKELEKGEEESEHTETVTKQTNWQKALNEQQHDEDEHETNVVNEETVNPEMEEKKEKPKFSFFFNVDDPRLNKGDSFKRSDDVDEISQQWENIKRNMYEDFRKKHKDAVRRVQKVKERRFTTSR